jgi:WD40 repeat protein
MADVFISYSSSERDFVRGLQESLRATNREAWVDWTHIPDAADWKQEIFDAIDAAHKFVFVISAASLASKMCREELDYAVAHGKRVIPIALQALRNVTLPEPLDAIQAIRWNETGPLEGLRRLVDAVEVDLDLQRSYARLLTRAKEWDSKGCGADYVLRGRDVADAELLLPRLNETPAIVQRFVQASRIQHDTVTAERKSQAAQRLTLEASTLLAGRPSSFKKAVMLAIEAAELAQSPQVDEVLRGCFHLLPRLIGALQHPSLIHRLAFSSDGRLVASETGPQLSGDRQEHLWDVEAQRRVAGDAPAILGPEHCVSSDGRFRVEIDSETDTMRVRLVTDGTEWFSASVHQGFDGTHDRLRFARDGHTLIVADATHVRVWDLQTRKLKREFELVCSAIAVSPDVSMVALASGTAVELRSLATGDLVRRIDQSASIGTLEFDPCGTRLAVGSADGCVRFWTTGGMEISRIVHRLPVRNLAFSPDGHRLATSVASMFDFEDTLRVWELGVGRNLDGVIVATSRECRVDARSHHAVLISDSHVHVWSLATSMAVASLPLSGVKNASVVGDQLIAALQDSELSLWNASTSKRLWRLPNVVEYDGGTACVAVKLDTGALEVRRLVDAALTGRLRWTAPVAGHSDKGGFGPFKLSPDSKTLTFLTRAPNRVRTVETDTGQLRLDVPGVDLADKIVWAGDGACFAVSSPSRFAFKLLKAFSIGLTHERPQNEAPCIVVHDQMSGATYNIATEGFCNSLQFSPDRERLLGGLTEGSASIWEVRTQRLLTRVSHAEEVWAAAFDSTGRMFATGGSDGFARLWDSITGEENQRIAVGAAVMQIAFDPGGNHLFTFDALGRLRRWILSRATIVAEARRLMNGVAEGTATEPTS